MEFDYYDISPKVSSELAVFPGDKKFQRKVQMSFEQNHHLELSSIETTLHIGAHADAPSHYSSEGESIDKRELGLYYGLAQVLQVKKSDGGTIGIEDIEGMEISQPRVLFCTDSFPDPNNWNSDFCSLSWELIQYLAAKGVRLVGIDTPSIDPENSKTLSAHKQVFEADMAILEGLVLSHVPEGEYRLVALPLPIVGADASPVRAILINEKGARP